MAHPQSQIPASTYQPSQLSPGHVPPPAGFPAEHVQKRPRLSSTGSALQAASPYGYGATSPGASATPTSAASPTHGAMSLSLASANYSVPYPNGHVATSHGYAVSQPLTPSGLQLTPVASPRPSGPLTPSATTPYSASTLAPMPSQPVTPNVMGPPLRPTERPVKEYQYDVDDSLAGTGIDLRQEEAYQNDYFAGKIGPEARTGFPANPPGSRGSMYGAGPANQPAQPAGTEDQTLIELRVAKQAWNNSARDLATTRSQEVRQPFLSVSFIMAKAEKIAKEHGIGLNLDPKHNTGMGKMKMDHDFPRPRVVVSTKVRDDGTAFVSTAGSFIPEDCYLADQIALLSIGAKHRIRELLEDVNEVAATRQQTSHGTIPEEWADAAAPLVIGEAGTPGQDASPRVGNESAVSPRTNPLKRSFAASQDSPVEKVTQIHPTNHLTQTLRESGRGERDWEESRLRKRQKREEKKADPTSSSRAGSVAPGTPGSVAPEPEKAPTKKELKSKAAAAKVAEAANTTSANRTSMAFLGGRKKQYSWMSAPTSGASSPSRAGPGSQLPTTPGATPGLRAVGPVSLTSEGRTKLGVWREDGEKGKNIQLRDWVVVLESDGRDVKALQDAYDKLDASEPK